MKRNKFKKLRLQLETLEPAKAENCVLLLQGIAMESPMVKTLSVESVEYKERRLEGGFLEVDMEAKGIRGHDRQLCHLRTGRQAEILDYNYFRTRYPQTIVTDIQAEVFDFRQKRNIPFAVKKPELSFGNGKKVDLTDKVSVFSLDRLAS